MHEERRTASQTEIVRWERIIGMLDRKDGVERLRKYVCSLLGSRPYGLDLGTYLEKRGLTHFYRWSRDITHPIGERRVERLMKTIDDMMLELVSGTLCSEQYYDLETAVGMSADILGADYNERWAELVSDTVRGLEG